MTQTTQTKTAHAAAGPAYPLPTPAADPRFTYGLILDLADVLTAHSYPPPAGTDLDRSRFGGHRD